jgi:hypothetical protein
MRNYFDQKPEKPEKNVRMSLWINESLKQKVLAISQAECVSANEAVKTLLQAATEDYEAEQQNVRYGEAYLYD